jgi:hypothetical protein
MQRAIAPCCRVSLAFGAVFMQFVKKSVILGIIIAANLPFGAKSTTDDNGK